MANRREFLQAAAAATAAPAVTQAAGAGGLASLHAADIRTVIVDRRFEPSRLFGAQMAGRGRNVHEIDADITDLWVKELKPLWTRKPVAIAGLTARSALFCLEQLAVDHRMRVVFHAEHSPVADGCAAHEMLTCSVGLTADHFADAQDAWPAVFAALLETGTPAQAGAMSPAGLAPSHEGRDETLATWIIAPIAKT